MINIGSSLAAPSIVCRVIVANRSEWNLGKEPFQGLAKISLFPDDRGPFGGWSMPPRLVRDSSKTLLFSHITWLSIWILFFETIFNYDTQGMRTVQGTKLISG